MVLLTKPTRQIIQKVQNIIINLQHFDPLVPPLSKKIPGILLDNWWGIYIIVSLTYLYHSRSNLWLDPIDHDAPFIQTEQ